MYWAVVLVQEILVEAENGNVLLSIDKRGWLKSQDHFSGCYIDNYLPLENRFGRSTKTQKKITHAFERRRFVISENDPAREEQKLIGVHLGHRRVSPATKKKWLG